MLYYNTSILSNTEEFSSCSHKVLACCEGSDFSKMHLSCLSSGGMARTVTVLGYFLCHLPAQFAGDVLECECRMSVSKE